MLCAPSRSPCVEPLPVDAFSGDLLCPFCEAAVEIRLERTEYGAEFVGGCANCNTIVEIDL